MSKKNKGWTITEMESANDDTTGAPKGKKNRPKKTQATTSHKKKKPIEPIRHQSKQKKQSVHQKTAKNNSIHLNFTVTLCIVAVIIFVFCIAILIQHSIISRLDSEVVQLQSQYDEVKSLNDAKEGQLVTSQNYSQIEATARSYGMTDPTSDQKVSMAVTKQNLDTNDKGEQSLFKRLFE